eukprot:172094_1
MDKPWIIFSTCCWWVAITLIIIAGFVLYETMEQNGKFQSTTCVIEQIHATQCQYLCNCRDTYNEFANLIGKQCETCNSDTYRYSTSTSVCNAQMDSNDAQILLTQESSDYSAPCGEQSKKEFGDETVCFVDCNMETFTFTDPTVPYTVSIALFSVGVVLCLCGAMGPFLIKSHHV